MHALVLLLTITSTLVLKSGDRITAEGPVREENGVVTFRMNGLLYSIPATEIESTVEGAIQARPADDTKRLAVSAEERDRLLRKLEQNHEGKEPPAFQKLPDAPPSPTREETGRQTREEWEWRRMARDHDEQVRRAEEELELLETRIERLQSEIRSFVSLGFKPHQFTYQTSSLMLAKESLPIAQLEVTRAERARDQFREDARRQGVLPGWLR
jgi:hypothetical protein